MATSGTNRGLGVPLGESGPGDCLKRHLVAPAALDVSQIKVRPRSHTQKELGLPADRRLKEGVCIDEAQSSKPVL